MVNDKNYVILPIAQSFWSRRGARAAFTLIEVAISLGIFSFAFIAILGVIPSGLRSMRDSIDATAGARILQGVEAGLRGKGAATNATIYFDESGSPTSQSGSLYTARVTLLSGGTLPGGTPFSGLMAVSVKVSRLPGGITDSGTSSNARPYVLWVKQ